jgi:hypothetical protein
MPRMHAEGPGNEVGGVRLHCLGGEPGPADLARHLGRLLDLPEGARREIWKALDPSLGDTIDEGADRALDAFCARHALTVDELGSVIKASRFLLRAAARANLTKAQLAEDVDALTGSSPVAREILLSGFDAAKARLRQAILRGTLEDHSKLVVDIGWQLEHIVASDRGERMDIALAALTFRYREGAEEKRVTLHLLPDAVQTLTAACQRLQR